MKVKIVCVGNLKEKYWQMAEDEYLKRLSRFADVKVIEVKESNSKSSEENIKIEGKDILTHLSGYVFALCVEGKQCSSEELSDKISDIMIGGKSEITFVIGGSDGLSDDVKTKADNRLSFSKMTFPHQLMRIVLEEQIYRAFTIQNNIKYHK